MAQRGGAGKRALVFILLFLVFFLGRLGYGYYTTPDKIEKRSARVPEVSVESTTKKNYATDKYAPRAPSSAAVPQVDQKYEKTATVLTSTKEYDKDEAKLRAAIKEYGAIVQFEHNVGRSDVKTRVLMLMIGVQPDSFDKFYAAAREIGRLESAEVTKIDRTNEYLDLKAQRESLEETRRSLMELKRMNGSIDELVNLQHRILEVDQQLQQLGVSLGDYDEVNEFCTVNLTLYEDHDVLVYPPDITRRVMIAFKWALKYYCAMMGALAFFSLLAFFSVAIAEKIRGWADPHGRHVRLGDEGEENPAEPENAQEPESMK